MPMACGGPASRRGEGRSGRGGAARVGPHAFARRRALSGLIFDRRAQAAAGPAVSPRVDATPAMPAGLGAAGEAVSPGPGEPVPAAATMERRLAVMQGLVASLPPRDLVAAAGPLSRALRHYAATGADVIVWNHEKLRKPQIDFIHELGKKAWVYTIDDPRRTAEFIEAGIDGIITNIPMDRTRKKESLAQEKMAVIAAMERFCNISKKYGKPIVTQNLHASQMTMELLSNAGIPMYSTSEQCALAMFGLIEYARIRRCLQSI